MPSLNLAWSLEWTTVAMVRAERAIKRFVRWVVTPAYWLLYVVYLCVIGFAVVALWRATQTGIWHIFWSKMHAYFLTSDSPTYYMYLALVGSVMGRMKWRSQRIREAALAGDERLAPVAVTQPDGALAEELPADWILLGGLHRIVGGNTSTRRGVGCLLTILFGGVGLLLLVLLGEPSNEGVRPILTVASVACAVLTLWFLRWILLVKRFVRVRACAAGLGWVTTKRRRARWDEVQAFLTVVIRDPKTFTERAVYAVETQHGMLAWELRRDASEEERQTHDRLCRLVARYAGQPLRDLSNSAELLTDEEPTDARDEPAPVEPDRVPVVRNPHVPQQRGCHPNLGCLSFLLLYGVILLLALAGVILQHV